MTKHIHNETEATASQSLLRVVGLTKSFRLPRSASELLRFRPAQRNTAIDNVSFSMRRGEILGIVGESGSGKSTLARCLIGLEVPDSGEIHFWDSRVDPRDSKSLAALRARVQIVFQDPYAALNPRQRIGDAIVTAAQTVSLPVNRTEAVRGRATVGRDRHLS